MSDTPLTQFMMKMRGSKTDPKSAAAKGASGAPMTTSTSGDVTSGKGGSISASATGRVLDGGRIKVNFVPVGQLQEIVGVGDKLSKRIHMLRLSQGNLTAKRLKEEFGGRMSAAILKQMDFALNDMLIYRSQDLKVPTLKPRILEDVFSSDTDTEDELMAINHKSGRKAQIDEVEEEPEMTETETSESEEWSAPAIMEKMSSYFFFLFS